jgi:hypothetical protein
MILLFLGALLVGAAHRRSRRGGRSRRTEHGHEQYGQRRAAGSERAGLVAPPARAVCHARDAPLFVRQAAGSLMSLLSLLGYRRALPLVFLIWSKGTVTRVPASSAAMLDLINTTTERGATLYVRD